MMSPLSSPTCHKKSVCISGLCSRDSSCLAACRLWILSAFCEERESFGYRIKIMLALRSKHSVPMSQSNFISFLGRRNGKELTVCNYINVNLCPLETPAARKSCPIYPYCSLSLVPIFFSHLLTESAIKECKFLKDKGYAIISLMISPECTEGTVCTCWFLEYSKFYFLKRWNWRIRKFYYYPS